MCLAQGPQRSDAGKLNTLPLSPCAPISDKSFNLAKSNLYNDTISWRAFHAKFSKYAEPQSWPAKQYTDRRCCCLESKASEFYALLKEQDSKIEYFDLISN